MKKAAKQADPAKEVERRDTVCHDAPMHILSVRISKERLERLYLVDGLSTTQIAERFQTNRESVRRLIRKYGITMRPRGYPFDKRRN